MLQDLNLNQPVWDVVKIVAMWHIPRFVYVVAMVLKVEMLNTLVFDVSFVVFHVFVVFDEVVNGEVVKLVVFLGLSLT